MPDGGRTSARRWAPEDIAMVAVMRAEGRSISAIASRLGRTKAAVARVAYGKVVNAKADA